MRKTIAAGLVGLMLGATAPLVTWSSPRWVHGFGGAAHLPVRLQSGFLLGLGTE